MDDCLAVHRLKKGDMGGLEILIARYQARAVRTAFLITHDQSLAEDVVQETFIRIYHRIRYYDEMRPFEPYLLRSVVHTALNVMEKTAHWTTLDEEIEPDAVANLLQRASATENMVEFAQLKEEIYAALGKLSPRQRQVIVQRYYLEMSEKEMAEELSVAPGTVKWLLNGARQRLRMLMGMEGNKQ